jgi:hypothetical protein
MRASGALLIATLLLAVAGARSRDILQECPIYKCKEKSSKGVRGGLGTLPSSSCWSQSRHAQLSCRALQVLVAVGLAIN